MEMPVIRTTQAATLTSLLPFCAYRAFSDSYNRCGQVFYIKHHRRCCANTHKDIYPHTV